MNSSPDLFRKEAVEAQHAFSGRTRLAPPLSWTAINALLLCLVIGAVVFASLSDYARTINATGVVDTDLGTLIVAAERQGTVDFEVALGDVVEIGEVIAITHSVAQNDDGGVVDQRRVASLKEARSADLMASMAKEAGAARAQAHEARALAAEARIVSLDEQLLQAREQTARARSDLARAVQIAERGFLARSELERRESAVAQLSQAEASVVEQIAQVRGERDIARAEAEQALREAEVEAFDARSIASRARRGAIADDALDRIVHVATSAGRVAALPQRDGALIRRGEVIAVVVPENSRKIARISVPAAAMADLKVGQDVRVAIDAYPYQTFGMVDARVASVSRAATNDAQGPVFLIEAELPDILPFYGGSAELLPGMTLEARITTRKRSLLDWLLDPLLSVSRR